LEAIDVGTSEIYWHVDWFLFRRGKGA